MELINKAMSNTLNQLPGKERELAYRHAIGMYFTRLQLNISISKLINI